MNRFLENKELQKKRYKREHYKFTLDDLPCISWDQVFLGLSDQIAKKKPVKKTNHFGMVFDLQETGIQKNIFSVLREFSALNKDFAADAHMYISLTDKSATYGWHQDPCEVIFWQAIGKTLFSVNQNNTVIEYSLSPNDLIYIPQGMQHSTKPLSPRVGISMGFNLQIAT